MVKLIRILATVNVVATMLSVGARAQVAGVPAVTDTMHLAADSAGAQPKKKGMFGKMKSLAHNKTAQNIVKAAACTAIPGGSYVVGAMDARAARSAAGVAGNAAAGAASAAVGGGAGCIPGMGGMSGLGAAGGARGAMGAGAMAGLTSASMAAGGGSRMVAMQRAMSADGGGGPARGATSVSNGSIQMTPAQMQAMAAAQQTAGGGAAVQTEAAGQQMQMPHDPAADLAKGKLVIKKVDWVQHANVPSASTTQMLTDVMSLVGTAIKQSGAKYRVDVYVSKDYQDAEAKQLAASRITTVIGMINNGAAVEDAVVAGKAERDKEGRIEIVKVK